LFFAIYALMMCGTTVILNYKLYSLQTPRISFILLLKVLL